MRSIFARAHAFTARWEGGFANHANDPGGATQYGVSLRWLRGIGCDLNGDGDIDAADVKAVTPELARDLFRIHFWETAVCDLLPPLIAVPLYDAAVNMGTQRAVKQLQSACNAFRGEALKVDGIPGQKTIARIKELCPGPQGELALALTCVDRRDDFYRDLANGQGRYGVFLQGWLNRTGALRRYLRELADGGVV